jgi:hypothetical protein
VSLKFNEYQFGRVSTKEEKCRTFKVVDSIIDISTLPFLQEYSPYNYNYTYIKEVNDSILSYENLVSGIHEMLDKKDKLGIEKSITELTQILTKYDISFELNPSKMAEDILIQNLDKNMLVKTGFFDYKQRQMTSYDNIAIAEYANEVEETAVKAAVSLNNEGTFHDEVVENYSVHLSEFDHIVRNNNELLHEAGYQRLLTDNFFIYLIACLIISFIIIILKNIPIRNILIGVVVVGLVSTLVSIISIILAIFNSTQSEDLMLNLVLITISVISILGTYQIFNRKSSKKLLMNFAITIFSAVATLPPFIILYIRENTKINLAKECVGTYQEYLFEYTPIMFVGAFCVGIYGVFLLLKKLHSKAE